MRGNNDKPNMIGLYSKRSVSKIGKLWAILLLLLGACAPATSATPTETPGPTPIPTLSGPSYTNPVYKRAFADPHVLRVGDTYYAYATFDPSVTSNFQVIQSTDLVNWERLADALPGLPEWSATSVGLTWAPGVIQIEDTFVMYYTARDKESNRQCIGRAISDNPAGPFVDDSTEPFICQDDLGGSIDPYPYLDDDGKLYLLWKNDGNCCNLGVWLWGQELSPDGLTLMGEPVKLLMRDQPWERPLIENPAVVEHDDTYYLFYSANKWDTHEYAIGYAVCESVLGPCEKPLTEPWLDYENPVMGPGGQAFFTDEEGNLWMAYHAWTGVNIGDATGDRSLRIDLVTFEDGKPVTDGPTYTPQLLP
jgi:beta-xylosidase